MKHKSLFSKLFLIAVGVTIGILVSLTTNTKAQNEVIAYLEERYKQQNIPVAEITVLQESPLRLQIVIQSASDGKFGTPDDPINFHFVEREVVLAAKRGYFIESFTRITINTKGEQIAQVDTPVYVDSKILEIAPSKVSNEITKDIVNDNLNSYGMSLTNIDVTSVDGLQFLTLHASSSSLEDANRAGPQLVSSLPKLIENINAQGSQIEICRLEIRDEKGNILLNYLLDIQLRSQSWWSDERFIDAWSKGPP